MNEFLFSQNNLKDVLNLLERNPIKICIILNDDKTIAGTVTDGDLRRHFLKNGNLLTSVTKVMNVNPITAFENTNMSEILNLMNKNKIRAIPLIDKKHKFKKVVSIDENFKIEDKEITNSFSFAVIMAGGEGKRLRPLTKNIPKPMVQINGIPILQHQIEQMVKNNIKEFVISLNYLGNVIEKTLGDGSGIGVKIEYIREKQALDTAGSLSLITKKPKKPVLIINGDIITNMSFKEFLNHHVSTNSDISIGSILYSNNIPYGVINTNNKLFVKSLDEKPVYNYLCNAGIYIFSPNVFNYLDMSKRISMTEFISSCIGKALKITTFPIYEKWYDIGTLQDLRKAEINLK